MKTDFVKPLMDWYHGCRRDLPWRHTSDPYRIWISEIMLQQTRVEAVRSYYARFLEAFPRIEDLAEAEEEKLLKMWEGLGYYNRVRNMQKAAQKVVKEYSGRFPETAEEILDLPGIGTYTAGAVASIAYGERVPAVDGNVLRVMARLQADPENILSASVKKRTEVLLTEVMQVLPETRREPVLYSEEIIGNAAADFNQSMFELGALVCLPGTAARCEICPVREHCEAFRRGKTEELPVRLKNTKKRIEDRTVLLVRSGDLTAVRKRPGRGLLAGMYEFPNVEGILSEEEAVAYVEENGYDSLRIKPLPPAKHVFSHVEWHMTGYEIRIASPETEGVWIFAGKEELSGTRPLPVAFAGYARFIDVNPGIDKTTNEE